METQRSGNDPRHASGVESGDVDVADDGDSRSPSLAFRVLAWITTLWFLARLVFGLLEIVLMWLPDETLASSLEFTAADFAHRTHFLSTGIVAWAIMLPMAVQLRKPWRRVAPMALLIPTAVAMGVVYGLSGTLEEWLIEDATMIVPVLLLAWLHPRSRDLISTPHFDRGMTGLSALATVPWAVFAFDNARRQLENTGSHAELEHWATAALMAAVIIISAFVGSTDYDGWRLPAWIAAIASLIYGLHSLVFPGLPSALSTIWAVAAIGWALVFGMSIVVRSKRDSRSTP